MTLGDDLDAIMRDMDAAYAAIRDAGHPPLDSPEHQALDAVYARLRAWNALAASRHLRPTATATS